MKIAVSEQITMREIAPKDAEIIFKTIDSQREYLRRWLPFVEDTKDIDFTRSFIHSICDTLPEEKEYTFILLYEGEFAGLIGFRATDRANQKTEIGYWLSEYYQHRGIISSSVPVLLRFAFNEWGINRVQIRCGVGNTPSRNIPLRLGFHFEGVERAGERFPDGSFIDLEVYSMLKSEFGISD